MDLSRTAAIIGLAGLGLATTAAAGEIHGLVQLDDPVPPAATITVTSSAPQHPVEGCGALTKPSPWLLVDSHGGVQNAVVWLERPGRRPEPPREATQTVDQRACMFEPHLLLLPAGGTLVIKNSDAMLHNVRIFQDRTMLLHAWQPPHGAEITWRFDAPGRFLVRCGVHAWMYAWVVVTDQRDVAVTDPTGAFQLPDVPAGRYTLHVWHETLGDHQQRVLVSRGRSMVTVRVAHEGGST